MRYTVMPYVRGGVCQDPDFMVGFARHAEALGFESIVAVEHPLVIGGYTSRYPYTASGRMPLPDDCPIPDPLDLLAFVAGATTTIGLATGLLVLPAHHPVPLAKRLATLDRLSKGRLRLCIGLGWLREELEACGTDFTTRGRRTDESIDVLRILWADSGPQGASHHGEFFAFEAAHSFPKPARAGGIPIDIGGHSPASVRRAARRGDGWAPLGLEGEALDAAIAALRRETAAAGRDPDGVELTLGAVCATVTPEVVASLAAKGAVRVTLHSGKKTLPEACDELSEVAERLGIAPGGAG
ncbi:MAG TPA: LLM class F420-dependent oxidoreductase [Acidimicrobiales bacterium]|nr:LLM class F420-dependent oxidoreductase [Acidimicrobiales bacterium]